MPCTKVRIEAAQLWRKVWRSALREEAAVPPEQLIDVGTDGLGGKEVPDECGAACGDGARLIVVRAQPVERSGYV